MRLIVKLCLDIMFVRILKIKLFFLLLGWFFILPVNADTVVIAHPTVGVKQVSSTFLSRVYAMQIKTWPNGVPIKVYSFSTQTPQYTEFVSQKAKLQPHQ